MSQRFRVCDLNQPPGLRDAHAPIRFSWHCLTFYLYHLAPRPRYSRHAWRALSRGQVNAQVLADRIHKRRDRFPQYGELLRQLSSKVPRLRVEFVDHH